MTVKGNCSNCNRITNFIENHKGKLQCERCQTVQHKCKTKRCNNMIKHGLYCKKCVGKGLHKGGTLLVTGAVIAVSGKAKMLWKIVRKKIKM